MTPQVAIAAAALAGAGIYFGHRAYSSWVGTKLPEKDKPKPGETIDISSYAGVQKGLIALGYSVGATGADGKPGPNTGAGISKFLTDQGMAASTIVDNAMRTALAKALRAKGYTVTGETGPTFTGGGTPPEDTKKKGGAVKVPLADAKEAQADALDAEADALDGKADKLEADAEDASAIASTAMLLEAKKLRDLAEYKRGQAAAFYGEAKLLRAASKAEAAAKTTGYAAVAGSSSEEAKQIHHCYGEGLEHGHRDKAEGKPAQPSRTYAKLAEPLRQACVDVYKKGYAKAYSEASVGAHVRHPAWRARTRYVPASEGSDALFLKRCYEDGFSDGVSDRQALRSYNDDPVVRFGGSSAWRSSSDFGTPALMAACLGVYKKGYAEGWNATSPISVPAVDVAVPERPLHPYLRRLSR